MTRATIRLFLPLAIVVSVLVMSQGVPQTFEGAVNAVTLEGGTQMIARGVTAGVVSIKQLGTNGGGYFGLNSTHPSPRTRHPFRTSSRPGRFRSSRWRWWCMLGGYAASRKLAVVIYATMLAIYLPMVVVRRRAGGRWRIRRSRRWASIRRQARWRARRSASAPGCRALWAVTTTATSNGSVNAMHDSPTPLGGLMPLVGMWLNNIFGGVGVGFINMLIFVIVDRLRGGHDDWPVPRSSSARRSKRRK